MKSFFEERRPHDGLTYDEYLGIWREKLERSQKELGKDERKLLHFMRYNYERSQQVHDHYEPSDELRRALAEIEQPQLWMVLTEEWCGDSAYNLPVIAEAATRCDQVELRILHRDEHPDIMDQYLTDGKRSIPKLVAFSEQGEELFRWGPRPVEAATLFQRRREEGADKMDIIDELMDWYKQQGWEHVDEELAEVLHQALPTVQ